MRLNAFLTGTQDEGVGSNRVTEATDPAAVSVLFVCMGNICRSPMAEGLLRHRLSESANSLSVMIDSAGTHSYHVGASPDRRACDAAARRGVDIKGLQARRVEAIDFERFDYILAMDQDNRAILLEAADTEHHDKIHLLLDFSRRQRGADVPDPYYGGVAGFERVLDLVEEAIDDLISALRRTASAQR